MTATLAERIEGLDDEAALRALAAVVDKQGGMLGTQAAAVAESRVSEALGQPEMAELAPDSTAGASDGDVARATLVYLAEEAGLAPEVERALSMVPSDDERFEPLSMAVGALVLFALRSESSCAGMPSGDGRSTSDTGP